MNVDDTALQEGVTRMQYSKLQKLLGLPDNVDIPKGTLHELAAASLGDRVFVYGVSTVVTSKIKSYAIILTREV